MVGARIDAGLGRCLANLGNAGSKSRGQSTGIPDAQALNIFAHSVSRRPSGASPARNAAPARHARSRGQIARRPADPSKLCARLAFTGSRRAGISISRATRLPRRTLTSLPQPCRAIRHHPRFRHRERLTAGGRLQCQSWTFLRGPPCCNFDPTASAVTSIFRRSRRRR